MTKNPLDVIKARHITEKARVLEELQGNESNPSVARCKRPKSVFIVDRQANKDEIKKAINALFAKEEITVTNVNTLIVKPKRSKRGRGKGRPGKSSSFKKAIVTFEAGDRLENV